MISGKRFIVLSFLSALVILAPGSAFSSSFAGYPDPEEMYAEIYALQEKWPELALVGEYGKSAQGGPLLYIRIAAPGGGERAQALVAANIHGNEWIGNRAAMGIARRLLEDGDKDSWIKSLLDRIEFYILPCINPDGYRTTWENADNENAAWPLVRKNANKVDLNRNFPLPGERTVDHSLAGSADPDNERYAGPYPYSEPETAAIRDFVASKRFFAAIDFHSNWGTFFPPKCNSASCEKQFRKMLDAAAEKQKVKYPAVSARKVDSFSGEMEDTLFYDYGIMAVCWEIFPESYALEQKKRLKHPFWSMNPEDVGFWVENERDAALAAIEKAFEITGGRPLPERLRGIEK